MQVTMWLVLAGTVGLAALVTRERNHRSRAELAQVRTVDTLTVTLPTKWKIVEGGDGATLLIAREPGSAGEARTLTIRRQRVRGVTTPQAFLTASGLLRGAVTAVDEEDPDQPPAALDEAPRMQPVQIAGWPGVMTVILRPQISPMGIAPSLRKHVLACTILQSSRQAIVLDLESSYGDDHGIDEALVRQVAEHMRVRGESALRQETALTLSSGVILKLPESYAVMPQTDPNRTNQLIVLDRTNGERLAIELVPCVLLPDDPPDDVRTMLLLHHPSIAKAEVRPDSEGIWRIKWPAGQESQPITGARVIARDSGNSVLLVFAGAAVDGGDFRHAYDVLARGASETATAADCGVMIAKGVEEAARLTAMPLEDLLGRNRAEEWWTLRDKAGGTGGAMIGWVHVRQNDADRWADTRESRYQLERQVVIVNESWREEESAGSYRYDMKRTESYGEGDAHLGVTSTQATLLHRGRLGVRATYGEAVFEPSAGSTGSRTSGFVPGGWLSRALGKLQRSKPMVLRTESLPSGAGRAVVQPMRLIVTPGGPPEMSDDGKTSLRCLSVEVSGTGEVIRCYFREDSTLDQIDLPDNLQQTRSDLASVRFGAGADARMAP